MKKYFLYFVILLHTTCWPVYADEQFDTLVDDFPSILTNFSNLGKQSNHKIVWSRTDLTAAFSINQLSVKDSQLHLNKKPVNFLSPEQSIQDYTDFYGRRGQLPLVIYKWEINAESEGLYYISIQAEAGLEGFLNNDSVITLCNGIISKKNSGNQRIALLKGKNFLYLSTIPNRPAQLMLVAEKNIESIKTELLKKISSASKEDFTWTTTVFIPYLCTIENGYSRYITHLLSKLNKLQPFENSPKMAVLLRSYITKENHDSYQIEKYLYTNFPEHYFQFSKSIDPKFSDWESSLISRNSPRTIFLQQLIYDGQKELAEQYFNKCLEFIKNKKEFPDKEKYMEAFYSQRFVSFFRIGRIRDANEILKSTQEICKQFPLPRYLENRPEQEDLVTLTQSFDESSAFQLNEKITGYEGDADQLGILYKSFLSLNNNLVKHNDGAISLFYLFQTGKSANEKLNLDFNKYCLDKIQVKIEKAKESRDIKLLQEILEQFEWIKPQPEIRLILMEEYFNKGNFLKALSQAHYLFDKYPELHSNIIPKMILLENFSDLAPEYRKVVPEKILKTGLKIKGQPTTLEKFISASEKPQLKLGKLLKTIPLEPTHIQYWNHAQIPFYQPIEPLFTKNYIFLNGASYLISFSTKSNSIEWSYHSEFEYKKDSENGPHQKRFITTQAGNQLFMLTNRDFSDHKTIKSFSLNGDLLWDISDQKSSLVEEPFCTPIESQGKLFCLTYSNRETINIVNYAVYDAGTGSLISKIPISYIPNSFREASAQRRGYHWNTFTHDNHFIQDGSFVYGYSGTGIIFKADSNSGHLLWEKGFPRPSLTGEYTFTSNVGYAPSGYIKVYDDILLSFMPDVQIFTAINKNSGNNVWKSNFYNPKFIHDRGKSKYLYFSNDNLNKGPTIYKVDPKNGEIIWQKNSLGLAIAGEGDLLGGKLYIPSEKSILIIDELTGKTLDVIPLNIQPLKIRCNDEYSVILTANTAFVLQNNNEFDSKALVETDPFVNVAKFIEPDSQPQKSLSFENINLEITLKSPEDIFSSSNAYSKTSILKTSKPFHFLLLRDEHLTLFREGYSQKDGKYIPPEIIWYGQYPNYAILEDTLYVSEYGKIIASNLFTREKIWSFEHRSPTPVFRSNISKPSPAIAVSKEYIAYQTANETICVLDIKTRNKILEFYSPAFRSMVMEGNYIVTLNHKSQAQCYDISQAGKFLWLQDYNHACDIAVENGNLIFVKSNAGMMALYDLKTGKVNLSVKLATGHPYALYDWHLDKTYLYAFNMLYDAKTGSPAPKYKEGAKVAGGGFIGFFKQYGSEGHFILDGKEFSFQTQCNRDYDNKLFSAAFKGNRIVFFSSWGIETFEIEGDRLISVDYTKFYSGPYGNHEAGMSLFPLDNSVVMLRKDEIYFYKNFDTNLIYEKIKSCRVENKTNVLWPYSEIYPEVEVDEKNWISFNGEKPKRSLFYQAFGDENFAYLKFKLSPRADNSIKNTLYISANGFTQVFAITWDADNWKNCQYTFNIKDNIESWKETDIKGNIHLYIKLKLNSPIASQFKSTLPDFNIELRQMTGKQNDGMFRLGGAYFKSRKFFPWMTYLNDEGQTLKDFTIRTKLFEENTNFYPQGDDLISWLKDRRRIKSIESNLQLLNQMLEKNAKFYCVVNILSALLLEEIQALKLKQPELEEISDEFIQKTNEIIQRLHKTALAKGINKEWADYALSFWTIEIFPFKFNYNWSRSDFFKAIHGISVTKERTTLLRYNFSEKDNILTPNINQPYLEWVIPGLTSSFPNNISYNQIELNGIHTTKTGFGRMNLYSPSGHQEFCTRKGKLLLPSGNISSGEKLATKDFFYYSKNIRYDCFFVIFPSRPTISISIEAPPIKSPNILKNTGQTAETIMTALENLPSDNKNGLTLVDDYIALKGKLSDEEMIALYAKWLYSMKDSHSLTYYGIKSIYSKFEKQKNPMEFLGKVIKEAKLKTGAPRHFMLDRINKFVDKNARSVLGPVFQELEVLPEKTFSAMQEYKAGELKYKFKDDLDNKIGGDIYIASKVIVPDKDKAFLFIRAGGPYYSQSIFSAWSNGIPLAENVSFTNFDDNTFAQRINLNKGENIILIKISGLKDREWGHYYSIGVGDVYGIPINGIEMKAVHK